MSWRVEALIVFQELFIYLFFLLLLLPIPTYLPTSKYDHKKRKVRVAV